MSTLNERAGKALAGRWRAGMLDTWGRRFIAEGQCAIPRPGEYRPGGGVMTSDALPDMSDPATLGAYLAVVREAYGDPCGWVQFRPDRGWEFVAFRSPMDLHPTEAEALVAALEAKQ
jgi:hypothetical protein